MKWLKRFYFSKSLLIFFLIFLQLYTNVMGFLKTTRIEEIPFTLNEKDPITLNRIAPKYGIHAMEGLEKTRGFLHIFKVPYIVCFFAAKGKWPFIPPVFQNQVDAAAKTLFAHDDSYIKRFCQKFIQIKECFRPLFATATAPNVGGVAKVRPNSCPCATEGPVVYFDRDHIGSVSSETVLNTIEFLESFLAAPTKKTKRRKNHVRGRVDEMDVD